MSATTNLRSRASISATACSECRVLCEHLAPYRVVLTEHLTTPLAAQSHHQRSIGSGGGDCPARSPARRPYLSVSKFFALTTPSGSIFTPPLTPARIVVLCTTRCATTE